MSLFKPPVGHTPTPTITADAYVIPLLQPDRWFEEAAEGELAVDVYETPERYVVQSTLAGVRPDDLTLSVHRDLLTIRGKRERPLPKTLLKTVQRDASPTALTEECYWGTFSRSLLLPEPVDVSRSRATVQHGVLTIELPKTVERTEIKVIQDEDEHTAPTASAY